MVTVEGKVFLTVKEFAEAVGARPATIRLDCAVGKLPGAFKICDHQKAAWLIPQELVETFKLSRRGRPRKQA